MGDANPDHKPHYFIVSMKENLIGLASLIVMLLILYWILWPEEVDTSFYEKEREVYREEIERYKDRIVQLKAEVASLEYENLMDGLREDSLRIEVLKLKKRAHEKEIFISGLDADSTAKLLTKLSDTAW